MNTVSLIGSSIANKNNFVFFFLPMSTETYDWIEGIMMRFKAVIRLLHSKEIEDLESGMVLEGCVTIVANLDAFVDIGVHQNGLVHISEITSKFVKNIKVMNPLVIFLNQGT